MQKINKPEHRKFPPKQKNFDGKIVDFKKINEDFPSALYIYNGKGYQELYPSVYSIEIADEGFVKIYNFFPDLYLENLGLINYRQFSLYNYISTLRNRGYYLSLKGNQNKNKTADDILGLAQVVGVGDRTLIDDLDHLEDCLLMHRVQRLDLKGNPNELIIHTPFTLRQLEADNGRRHKIIAHRIATSFTRNQRNKAKETGTSEKGKSYGYINRTKNRERFQIDYKFIKKAFGESSIKFADFALDFFKKNLKLLKTRKNDFDYAFRVELSKQMTNNFGIGGNSAREQCYIAANKFRTIYCPTDEEILATF